MPHLGLGLGPNGIWARRRLALVSGAELHWDHDRAAPGSGTELCLSPGPFPVMGPGPNRVWVRDHESNRNLALLSRAFTEVHNTPPQELCQRRPKTNQLSRWLIKPSQINPEETQNFEQLKPVDIFIINTYNK